jgi:pyruvate dehydrogenase E2 component (dihydrolipoamide acetyltransferase)
MPTPFIMPKMDMDQESVTINEWLKKEGETVEKGEPVVVIETDKITSDVEAPASGKLARILYKENEEAPVTKVIAYILQEDETEADLPKPAQLEVEKGVKQTESTLKTEEPQPSATPVAKRMTEEKGINLADITSAGEKITKRDVEEFLSDITEVETRVETPATPAARRVADEKDIDIAQVKGSGPRGRVQEIDVESFTAEGEPSISKVRPGEAQPISSMRKRIAQRMTKSYQTIPHIYLSVDVDMSEAEASRLRMNDLAKKEGTPNISLTAYLIRIVSWCLNRHPYLNASLENDTIKFWNEVNIGVATALEEGLIVPVVHNADQQSTRELNERLRYLAAKAREGELTREEVQEGTFTISNLGMYGIDSFTAIINPPQAAILAVGTIKRKPIVVDDKNTVEVRPIMTLTLAADHRIVDGVVAANFLSELVKALETPELLLL